MANAEMTHEQHVARRIALGDDIAANHPLPEDARRQLPRTVTLAEIEPGRWEVTPSAGVDPMAVPTLLRKLANGYEKGLGA